MQDSEYTCIKNEILQLHSLKHNYIIAMNTIVTALIGVAITSKCSWVYLVAYTILYFFQIRIDKLSRSSMKLGAFLAVFSEDVWEVNYGKIHSYINKKVLSKGNHKAKHRFVAQILFVNSIQLGGICSLLFMGTYCLEMFTNSGIKIIDIAVLLLPVFLWVCLVVMTNDSLKTMKKREYYIEIFGEIKYEVRNRCSSNDDL